MILMIFPVLKIDFNTSDILYFVTDVFEKMYLFDTEL